MKLLIFVLLFTALVQLTIFFLKKKTKTMKYYRYDSTGLRQLKASVPFEKAFSGQIYPTSNPDEADVLLLEKFSDQHIFKMFNPSYVNKILYTIVSIDFISSKSSLYELMRKNASESKLHKVFPRSFVIDNSTDLIEMKKYVESGKPVILKKNIQQQKGCLITRTIDDVNLLEYTIGQELLVDPFLISGRKINIRIYTLFEFDKYSNPYFYIHDDGFIYYAPEQFVKNTIDPEINITTGYIDRSIYEANPLTLRDFYTTLSKVNEQKVKSNIMNCFTTLFTAIQDDLKEIEQTVPMRKFVIMGADVALSRNLNAKIMEINKGPDFQAKDKRDGDLKFKVISDAFEIVELLGTNFGVNGFKRVLL